MSNLTIFVHCVWKYETQGRYEMSVLVVSWPVWKCIVLSRVSVIGTKKMKEYVQEIRNFAGHRVPTYGAVVGPVSLGQFSLCPAFLSLVLIHVEVGNS